MRMQRDSGYGAHLYMSLVESPLNLVFLPHIKMGLGGDDRRRAFIPIKPSFVLDVHCERSIDQWEAVKGESRRTRWPELGPFAVYLQEPVTLRMN